MLHGPHLEHLVDLSATAPVGLRQNPNSRTTAELQARVRVFRFS
jgi:hypothetical protein